MRLKQQEHDAIARATREGFAPGAAVFLFGSRVDDAKRGGDSGLLIEMPRPIHDHPDLLEKPGFLDMDNRPAWREAGNRPAPEYPDRPERRFAALPAAFEAVRALTPFNRPWCSRHAAGKGKGAAIIGFPHAFRQRETINRGACPSCA